MVLIIMDQQENAIALVLKVGLKQIKSPDHLCPAMLVTIIPT
jgi:hypothetical protein